MSRKILLYAWIICLLLGGAVGMVFGQSDRALTADYDADVAAAWFDLQLVLIKDTPGFSPPVASRALGYTGITLYEAVVPGMPEYRSLAGQLNELSELPKPVAGIEYHWPTVANSALASITRKMFPIATEENQAAIDALYDRFAAEFAAELDADVFDRSVTQGRVVADAIYIWSLTDGGHQGYTRNFPADFTPPVGDGLWMPTPQSNGSSDRLPALQPYWGQNRPFVLVDGDACPAPAPPEYSEDPQSVFYQEALEVYDVVENLTPEELEIARFWADDPGATPTPPGHSVAILTQVLRQERASLATAAEAYAKVGMAVNDAFIVCWHIKYVHNLLRPVTYINNVIDPDWLPPVNTPPFPEYTSGHSVQSGATAYVLTDLFGDDYAFTDHSHDSLGFEPRSFSSFNEYAQEAAVSRLYGGIHYRVAIDLGLEQGRCVGERISQLRFQ
jgi:hypothetical protein